METKEQLDKASKYANFGAKITPTQIMIKFKKEHNLKVLSVILSVVFLCNACLYADPVLKYTLRLKAGQGDDTYQRIIEARGQDEFYRLGENSTQVTKKHIDELLDNADAKGRKRLFEILDKAVRDKGFNRLNVQQRYVYVRLLTYGDAAFVEELLGLNHKSKEGLQRLFSEKATVSFADVSRAILAGVIDENPDVSFNTSNRMLDSPKILLIGPYKADAPRIGQFLAPPMGLYRIASYLDIFGIEVDVCDTDLLGEEKLEKMVKSNKYDIIGFSLLHPTVKNDIRLMHRLHEISPHSLLVAGGQGGAFNQKQLFEKTPVSVVARGFGEFSMLDMSVTFDRDRFVPGSFKGIPGLYLKGENNEPIETLFPGRYTMDDFRVISFVYDFSRVPYREYWRYMRGFYTDEQLLMMKNDKSLYTIRMITSSHCPVGCLFCSATNFLDDAIGGRQRPLILSAKDINILMQRALRAYPETEAFYFNDDDFIINKNRIFELADLVEQKFGDRGLYFLTLARVDDVNPQILKRMKETGFGLIIYGVESFSDRLLQDMHKKVRVKNGESPGKIARQAVEWTLEAGIVPLINLLIFYPTTRVDDLRITIDATVELMQKGAMVAVNTYVIPFAGSKIAAMEGYEHKMEEFIIEGSGSSFSTGVAVLPENKDMKDLAEASLRLKPLILREIREKYAFQEAPLPLPIDTLALFAAIYRNLGLATIEIDRTIDDIMLSKIKGATDAEITPELANASRTGI